MCTYIRGLPYFEAVNVKFLCTDPLEVGTPGTFFGRAVVK